MTADARKLKVDNKTHWSTRDLKRFFVAGLRALGARTDKTITVIYARKAENTSGYAYYPRSWEAEGTRITMRIPKGEIPMLNFAQVFEHEVGHTLDLRHSEMADWWTLEPKWHEDIVIGKKAEKKKVPAPVKREQNVRNKVQEYEKKLENLEKTRARYKKALAKWKRKEQYYDRKAAGG